MMKYNSFIEYILTGREIEFTYKNVPYFISKSEQGIYIMNCNTKNIQYFKTEQELIDKAVIDSNDLKYAWRYIDIDYIL